MTEHEAIQKSIIHSIAIALSGKMPQHDERKKFDPQPLCDALRNDGLEVACASEHGHGASEDIPYLRYKENAWFCLSSDEYKYLISLAKIGLDATDRLKKEMDEAAEHINFFLQDMPLNPRAHNWLIRNGYKDLSYQESVYGQEIAEL